MELTKNELLVLAQIVGQYVTPVDQSDGFKALKIKLVSMADTLPEVSSTTPEKVEATVDEHANGQLGNRASVSKHAKAL
jgi:hypothetical protein